MPFPLRIYTMIRKLNKHKLNVSLNDLVPNPSTGLILQLDYITSIIDSLIDTDTNIDIEDELENQ
jgi:hypothetical protein